jgi:CBS domain-containing protein
MDGETLVGIISMRDLVRSVSKGSRGTPAPSRDDGVTLV